MQHDRSTHSSIFHENHIISVVEFLVKSKTKGNKNKKGHEKELSFLLYKKVF
jgi:hypothetical protein